MKQRCKVCGHADSLNFYVPDLVWNAIVPEKYQTHVVCLACFDAFAAERDINYTIDSLDFAGAQMTFRFICVARIDHHGRGDE